MTCGEGGRLGCQQPCDSAGEPGRTSGKTSPEEVRVELGSEERAGVFPMHNGVGRKAVLSEGPPGQRQGEFRSGQ